MNLETWPGVHVDARAFEQYLAEHACGADLEIADLYLACALAQGDARAFALFEQRVMPQVERSLARIDRSASFVDEAKQALRQKLFVGEDAQILRYRGRGSLARWAAVTATRLALNIKRSTRHECELEDEALGRLPAARDPELDYVWQSYRATYLEALRVALEELDVREKNLLRQHYVDRLDLDALARMYRVHRTTVFRWLKRAEELLAEATRRSLEDRGVGESELRSVQRAAESRMELSILRLLRESETARG